jgi:hypothetical protein
MRKLIRVLAPVWLLAAACGLEGLFGQAVEPGHPTPDAGTPPDPQPAIVTGTVPAASVPELIAGDLAFLDGGGAPLAPTVQIEGQAFTASFPAGERYAGMRVVVTRGTVTLRAVVPQALPGETTAAGDFDGLDNRETAAALLIEAKASAAGRSLSSYPAATLETAVADVAEGSAAGALKTFFDHVLAVDSCSTCDRGTAPRFRAPVVTPSGLTVESALHPDFILANPIDYDDDGTEEDTTAKFDAALQAALEAFDFKACYCDEAAHVAACGFDKPMIQVVVAADFNSGRKDGNCDTIDRFRWAEDQAGARVFFAGGVHPDSPFQDPAIEQTLGAWNPNQVFMFDDGTHGDDRAGDGIWTVAFQLPVGMRIGY